MSYQKLKLQTVGAIRIITLSDPATMNAASVEMAEELASALREASSDAPRRCRGDRTDRRGTWLLLRR